MSRRAIVLAVLSVGTAAIMVACQDYNFNPIGQCIIQPGVNQVKLDDISTADILFVVDDSGSMDSKQQALANNFSSFISALADLQRDRVQHGLHALDFHIAVTTSSIFQNTGTFTRSFPASFSGCTQGLAVPNGPYPAGDFVAAAGNPKVLHFTKDLDWGSVGTGNVDPAITALIAQFQANIRVGSCGSGEEQHLEAARLAVTKALAGQQPGVVAGEWPHENSKMVVVWVADEDDCSNPNDPSTSIVNNGGVGNDGCTMDGNLPPAQQKRFPISISEERPGGPPPYDSSYERFFTSLGRPFGAGFVVSLAPPNCSGATCTPGTCIGVTAGQDGLAAGVRFHRLAGAIGSRFQALEGSICGDFGATLTQLATLVKPPTQVTLSSAPASGEVTIVRIIDTSGNQRQVCTQAKTQADTATAGWWFNDCADQRDPPAVAAGTTSCIFINHASGACEANPGESYSAEFLGRIPPEGCAGPTSDGTSPSASCAALFNSSNPQAYSCYASQADRDAGATVGTCICRSSTGG